MTIKKWQCYNRLVSVSIRMSFTLYFYERKTTKDDHADFSGSEFAFWKLLLEKECVSMMIGGGTVFVVFYLFSIHAKLIS